MEKQSGCVYVGVCVCVYTPGANPVDSAPHPQSSLPAFDVNSLKLDLCAIRVTEVPLVDRTQTTYASCTTCTTGLTGVR